MVDADSYRMGGTADFGYGGEDYYSHRGRIDNYIYQEPENPKYAIVDEYGLKIYLGAFVKWCCSLFPCYRLLYWKSVLVRKIEKRFILLRRMFYLSGFRHGWRGLHWNIKPKMELN